MKAINYFLFISLIAFSLSCKKKDINVTSCHYSFLASKAVADDSLELVKINAWGKKITTYTIPSGSFGYDKSGIFGYNKNEHCVYSMRFNNATDEIYVYRLDLENKKIDQLTAISAPEPFPSYTKCNFIYNDIVNKFYLFYLNEYHGYSFETREVAISGNTFTFNHILLPNNRPLSPLCVNKLNAMSISMRVSRFHRSLIQLVKITLVRFF